MMRGAGVPVGFQPTTTMPLGWTIHGDLVHLVTRGHASFLDWQNAMEEVLASPLHRPGMGLVHDRRGARIPFTQEVRAGLAFVRRRSRRIGHARWSMVVSGDVWPGVGWRDGPLVEGTTVELRFFRDLGSAEMWARSSPGSRTPP
jgi:hypothetical protein